MLTDMKSRIGVTQSLAPAARTASANGTGVSMANIGNATAVVSAGVITDGVHTPKLQESFDGGTTYTDVAAANQIGAFVAITSNSVQRVGYIGSAGLLRVVAGVSGATTGGVYGAVVITGGARVQPVP